MAFDAEGAILGFFGADVNGMKNRRVARQKLEMSQAERRAVKDWALAHGYNPVDAEAASNDPNFAASAMQALDKPVEFATTGGSRYDPRSGTWIRAPGRDADGNEYAGSVDPLNPQRVMRRGTKAIPLQPGGQVAVVDSLTGLPVADDGSGPIGLGGPQQQPAGQGGRLQGWTGGMFGADPVRTGPTASSASAAPRLGFADPMGFRGGHMTSGRRTPEGNRAVGGVPNSGHLRGDDADFTPLPGQTLAQTLAQARQYFPGGRAAIHRGNHVHVDQPGYGQTPYFGKNGTRGAPPRISSRAQLDQLPSGAEFIAPDGSVRRKR